MTLGSGWVGLADRLRDHAADRPRQLAFRFLSREDKPGIDLDWGQLWDDAGATAARIASMVPPGGRIGVACERRDDFVVAIAACLCGGYAAVPIPVTLSRRSAPRAVAVATAARLDLVLISAGSPFGDLLREMGARFERSLPVSRGEAAEDVAARGRASDPDRPALIQFTSGSTGSPTGIVLSHGNLAANCAAIAATYGLRPDGHGLSWLPLNHDMGLIGHVLVPMWVGGPSTILDPLRFLQSPLAWLRLATALRATITSVPNFALELCTRAAERESVTGLDLSSLTAVVCGGEPVLEPSVGRFLACFERHGLTPRALAPSYGLAEATLLVSSGQSPFGPRFATVGGSVVADLGPPAPGMTVAVVRPDGTAADAGEVGEIVVAGTSVGRRLLADGSAAPAQPLPTGDRGALRDGRVHVVGRIKEMLILRGQNVFPTDIEVAASTADPVIVPGGVAAVGVAGEGTQQLVVLVEVERGARSGPEVRMRLARAVREAVARGTGHVPAAVQLLPFGVLPRTSSGKIRRGEAVALYTHDDASPTVPATQDGA